MLEAFERHLRTHNISKQFEEAKTKEDKIAVCKKFLEDEGYSVKSNLDPESQMNELSRAYGGSLGIGAIGPMGKITIGDMNYDPMTLAIDPSTMNSITVSSLDNFSVTSIQPEYISARWRVTEDEATFGFNDKLQMESYTLDRLCDQLKGEIRNFIINHNLIKSETDYSTNDKLFAVKIGISE